MSKLVVLWVEGWWCHSSDVWWGSCVQVHFARTASVWRRAVASTTLRAPPLLWTHTFTCWPSVWSSPPSANNTCRAKAKLTGNATEELNLFPVGTGCDITLDIPVRISWWASVLCLLPHNSTEKWMTDMKSQMKLNHCNNILKRHWSHLCHVTCQHYW